MVIGHKHCTDGDWNTWVPSVRISCSRFVQESQRYSKDIMALQITSLCKLFRHEKRFYINTWPTY